MDGVASSSVGPRLLQPAAAELSLGTRVALEAAKSSIEQAVNIVQEELTTLQAAHALLQSQYIALQKQHEDLQKQHQTQVDSWKEFKVWWKKTTEKKKVAYSTQQTPARGEMNNNNHPSSPLMTPSSSSKTRLTTSELALLNKVDLDCSAFSTPITVRREKSSIAKVKRENDEEVYRVGRMSLESRRIQSDGASYSDKKIHQHDNKRRRSSPGADQYSIPSHRRRVLEDVGNTTRSEFSDDQEEYPRTIPNQIGRPEESKEASVKRKGRGRYSTGTLTSGGDYSKTINEEFEVNPEKNGNVAFLHKAVVRDKAERKQMHAHDCECCSEYYKAVGEAPLRRYQDPRSLADQCAEEKGTGPSGEDNSEGVEERKRQVHRQQISRHRGYGPPAATPPGYWNVGFPSTQQKEDFNKLAREEHAKQRDQITRNPQFKRRA